MSDSAFGLTGFTRNPIEAVLGTVSCSISNCLGNKLLAKKLTPVTFPPGRLRLATIPTSTGSAPITKTIGTVVLAAFAARVAGVAPVTITATLRWTPGYEQAGDYTVRFIATDDFTVADILMTHVLDAGTKPEMLKPYPNILAYRARCTERPAWKKTLEAYNERVEAA